ncbi:Hypothetical protein MexAM1_META1p0884 [Methylorubrum extorquens AM1]|uniref:Uncharacterized protein n=1 Tax=Methylorubrum extorquens (strain ATCC 14718 / DSM 1338 / JCM 2805 / NCIMB 9133 / AM1) TaxID=272630 RepID=C5AWH0_METEA|nr:Hypothetical protein MexAM1_META1p0884 [Methylorubrum extorquens AM1]
MPIAAHSPNKRRTNLNPSGLLGRGWRRYSSLTAAILAAHGFLGVPFGYSVGGDVWNAGDIRDVAPDRTAETLAVLHSLPLRCFPRSRTRLAAGNAHPGGASVGGPGPYPAWRR